MPNIQLGITFVYNISTQSLRVS